MKKIAIIGLILLAVVAVFFARESRGAAGGSGYVLSNLEGNEVRLSDYRGKPVILWFWTTWCPFCRKAIPGLNSISSQLKDEGIELLGINVQERKETLQNFLSANPINFKVLADKTGDCARHYGVVGLPTYVILDKNGVVKFKENYFPKDNYKDFVK